MLLLRLLLLLLLKSGMSEFSPFKLAPAPNINRREIAEGRLTVCPNNDEPVWGAPKRDWPVC